MNRWEIPVTVDQAEALVDRTPESIEAYLIGRGLQIDGISVSVKNSTVTIISEQDPTPYLSDIVWPTRRDGTAIRRVLQEYAKKVDSGQAPTNAESVRAIRALIAAIARD